MSDGSGLWECSAIDTLHLVLDSRQRIALLCFTAARFCLEESTSKFQLENYDYLWFLSTVEY